MPITKRGEYFYGDSQADIREELRRYSDQNAYPIDYFADCVCVCGARLFELHVDEDNGVGGRTCLACGSEHVMADGAQYLDDAELESCECLCGQSAFEITAGVHVYRGANNDPTEDVRWFYIGCRCPECGLVGCYADWKNEYNGYQELLAKV